MEQLLTVLFLSALCWYFYRWGKQLGSRKGYHAGRRNRRPKQHRR